MLHVLTFDVHGLAHGLYTEIVDLGAIGSLQIVRASTIEFNNVSKVWEVKTAEGTLLYSHPSRTACLAWEHQYFNR